MEEKNDILRGPRVVGLALITGADDVMLRASAAEFKSILCLRQAYSRRFMQKP